MNKANDYDKILLQIIPHLENYPSFDGNEGTAFMISDKFVVKEIKNVSDSEYFDKIFQLYCEELQSFGLSKYSVPLIYSWVKIPENENDLQVLRYRYFILEQRVSGRELYYSGTLRDIFRCCKNLATRKELDSCRKNISQNNPLRQEVVRRFIKDYIKINEQIESMPESELETFVYSIYKMYETGKYSIPDIFSKNILINQNSNLKIIDNSPVSYQDCVKQNSPAEFTLYSLIMLMCENANTKESPLSKIELKNSNNSELCELIMKNTRLCKVILTKLIKVINKFSNNEKLKDKKYFQEIERSLSKLLGNEAEEILNLV